MDDRPRKDRLIQTRVPQDLECTLKDEARKRRLSVSHLIRNVLEDTFSLVDNVVHEVDRVVTDSVEMAQTLKRDAQRLAATARGQTAHREPRESRDRGEPAVVEVEVEAESPEGGATSAPGLAALGDVFGFQELIVNRPVACGSCGTRIGRGARAYLGMSDAPAAQRVWACQECIDTLGE